MTKTIEPERNKSLSALAYYQTGGRCDYFFAPETIDELQAAALFISTKNLPYFLLGGGTNSLVSDEDWEGAVISFHRLKQLHINHKTNQITAQAGVINSDLVEAAIDANLVGLGWMYRLPGQIGGTVRMNARCYGGEIGGLVHQVTTVDPQGELHYYDLSTPELRQKIFRGYKDTTFMINHEMIAEATFALTRTSETTTERQLMNRCASDRETKGQFLFPTCGCVFKNDYSEQVSISSGFLLERSGVQGMNRGQALVSPQHSNFVYNKGASSRDIIELTLAMRTAVYDRFGIWLDYEMVILGSTTTDLTARIKEQRPFRGNMETLNKLRAEFSRR